LLGYSPARGPARLLLAALAALADENGSVDGLTTGELCRAAGLANSTYRRARAALLASREVSVDGDSGGRGRTCRWTVARPAEVAAEPVIRPRRRVAPQPGARPLLAAATKGARTRAENVPSLSGVSDANSPSLSDSLSEVSDDKGPNLSGVSAMGPSVSGVSAANPAKTPHKPRHPSEANDLPDSWTDDCAGANVIGSCSCAARSAALRLLRPPSWAAVIDTMSPRAVVLD
jgi:hypothetical protein